MEWWSNAKTRLPRRSWTETMIKRTQQHLHRRQRPQYPITPSLHSSITPLLPIPLFEHAPNRFLGKSALIVGGSNDRNSSPKKSRKSRSDELVAEACIAHKSLS
jgi:hypothetical protein